MDKFIAFLNTSFAPKLNKFTKNPWVYSIQTTITMALPLIFVGSLVSLINALGNWLTFIPNLSMISDFSFGIISLVFAYLIPYNVLDKKKVHKLKSIAGMASLGFFLLISNPTIEASGWSSTYVFDYGKFGANGMLNAMVCGFIVAFVMGLFAKFSLFGKNSVMPDFVANWFNAMVPVFLLLLGGYIIVGVAHFDFFNFVESLFSPLMNFAQTLPGFVITIFLCVFLYSLGISSWAIGGVTIAIWLPAIAANMEAVANGLPATNINTCETIFTGFITIGGTGCTLPLVLMMLKSKSKRISAIAKAGIIPSVFNINEPIIFGTPIAWNPLLMIPMWIVSIVTSIVVYLALSSGLVPIATQMFQASQFPFPVGAYINSGIRGVVLVVVVFVIASIIWYPFFKAYESQVLAEEAKAEN
jgi:PTS system cellobiose-specific IIC component